MKIRWAIFRYRNSLYTMRGIFGQWNLFCSKWDWSFTGLKWRWCILTGNTWSSFQLWLICRSSDRGHLSGSIFWGALQDLSERYGTIISKHSSGLLFFHWKIVSPYLVCGWGTEHPGLSWGTPDLVFLGHRIHVPPPPGRKSFEMHQPMTEDEREHVTDCKEMTDP